MTPTRGRGSSASPGAGLTLIETLVALSVLALHVVGWAACLHLGLALLRRTVAVAGDDGADGAIVCALAAAVPFGVVDRRARGTRHRSTFGPPWGLSLVETLVALGLGVAVVGLLAVWQVGSLRVTGRANAVADAHALAAGLAQVLAAQVEPAGRHVEPAACGLALGGAGRRLTVRQGRGDAALIDEIFADVDGGGRPALYLRRVPHARQPWIEDVTSFEVTDRAVGGDGRVAELRLALTHRDVSEPLHVTIALPHRPCLEVLP